MHRLLMLAQIVGCVAVAAHAAAAPPRGANPPVAALSADTPLTAGIEVTSATRRFAPGLKGRIQGIVANHDGRMGVSLHHLPTGETVEVNAGAEFRTASTIKLAVMCAAFDQLCSPTGVLKGYYDTRVYDTASSASGAGFIQRFIPGTAVEVKELVHFMITVSDNTGTNMLTEWLGGPQAVNAWLERNGFVRTRMNATVGGRLVADQALRAKWGLGVTTPHEMRRLMQLILEGRAAPETTATEEMLRVLGHQYFDDLVAGEAPPTVWVGSKSGAVDDSRSDVAAVASPGGTYILAVYTDRNADRRWTPDNAAEAAIRAVAREAWRHYNPRSRWSRPDGAGRL
jgi:beta-lactamase class A